MFQDKYYVLKNTGVYSDTLEAFGLAEIIKLLLPNEREHVTIVDKEMYYEIITPKRITPELVNDTAYKDMFVYIRTEKNNPPAGVIYIDYEKQKQIHENQRIYEQKKYTELSQQVDQVKRTFLRKQINDYQPKRHLYWSLFANLNKLKTLSAYSKLFTNVFNNRETFPEIIKLILELYSEPIDKTESIIKKIKFLQKTGIIQIFEEINALQLFNPFQGKGVNMPKASGIAQSNQKSFWVKEYLKIIGIFNSMIIHSIKVSKKTSDTRVYVASPKKVSTGFFDEIYNDFRMSLRGGSSRKLDIACIINFIICFIQHIEEYKQKRGFLQSYNPEKYIAGFYTAYFKRLGTSEAVSNLSFIHLPIFIDINSKHKGDLWIEVLSEHKERLTNNAFIETGLGLDIIQFYREFIANSDISFFLLAFQDYGLYVMQTHKNNGINAYPFSTQLFECFFELTKEYFMSETGKPLADIFQNIGFMNIAKAIRGSTVSILFSKKENRNYEIRYGLAQGIIRKSAYKKDLIEYLSEFIVSFNAENARKELNDNNKTDNFYHRANVKSEDIENLVALIDDYGSSIIGKLLAAYGYTLNRKTDQNRDVNEAEAVTEEDNISEQ